MCCSRIEPCVNMMPNHGCHEWVEYSGRRFSNAHMCSITSPCIISTMYIEQYWTYFGWDLPFAILYWLLFLPAAMVIVMLDNHLPTSCIQRNYVYVFEAWAYTLSQLLQGCLLFLCFSVCVYIPHKFFLCYWQMHLGFLFLSLMRKEREGIFLELG